MELTAFLFPGGSIASVQDRVAVHGWTCRSADVGHQVILASEPGSEAERKMGAYLDMLRIMRPSRAPLAGKDRKPLQAAVTSIWLDDLLENVQEHAG